MIRNRLLNAFLVLVAPALAAQAPHITPSGDPSVRSDTIYRLAVRPEDYPDEPYVFLLDDGVVRFESDGRGSRTYRQIVQVLDQRGVETWAEQSFGYTSSRERLTINWIRVLKPDGTLISDKPTQEQESLSPVAMDAPVYSDAKQRHVTLGGVAPGTLIDYSYTIEQLQPVIPGDFHSSWLVTMGRPTRRSRLIVDVPSETKARVKQENVRFPVGDITAHGRRVYTWATGELGKIEPEPFAAVPNSVSVTIEVTGPVGWSDVARWYAGLSKDRYEVTPELAAKAGEIVGAARSAEDTLRALHRWVAQDFRYVSLSLGIGGFQPRLPAAVLETRYGDCKDKATLFIALARRMGFEAFPVLLNSNATADSALPSISQFDHMIAAVRRPAGYLFLDLTADLTPYGQLPPDEQGGFALIVHPDGQGESVKLPEDSAPANLVETRITGTLSAEGRFDGRITERDLGTRQYELRSDFVSSLTAKQRSETAQTIVNSLFPGGTSDSLEIFDGRNLQAEARISVLVRNGQAATKSGGTLILTLPIKNYASPTIITRLQAHIPRRFPIDVTGVVGPITDVSEFTVTLPPQWQARLPPNVSAASEFGSYSASYSQEGQTLHVVRSISGRKGTEPPDRVQALIAWLQDLSRDDVRYLVIEQGK